MYVLEPATPLSDSMVWRLQRTFYVDQGIEAWSRSGVPQAVTTSPNIAQAYARIVQAYLADIRPNLDLDKPIYIVELGAGSGRFAYRFLKGFDTQGLNVVYVMTDAAPSVVAYWRTNERLQPFVDRGALEFDQFDLLNPAAFQVQHPGNPIVVIGNYIFDSIPQDAYTLRDGHVFRNVVTIGADSPDLDLTAPDSRVRISITFDADTQPTNVEDDPDPIIGDILRAYQHRLHDTSVLIPRTAMACVRFFHELGGGRGLCLIGDLGDTQLEELEGHGPPGFGAGGGFWLPVNFHALGEFTRGLGGHARHPQTGHFRLNISMLVFDGQPEAYPGTHAAYIENIDRFGPDCLAVVNRAVAEQMPNLQLEVLLALLRSTHWDPDYVIRAVEFLVDKLPEAEGRFRKILLQGVYSTWEQYYPIGEADDVPFGLGVLLFSLHQYADALEFFERSLRQFGEDPRTTLNLALTLYHLDRKSESLEWLDRTLALDPTNDLATRMRPDVLADLT